MGKQQEIFIAFFRSGILAFGGGPSVIPLIQKEVVEKYKMMDGEEFENVVSIANTLPGPIATKLAGYIGKRMGGICGCLNALIASVLPTVLAMIILLASLTQFSKFSFVESMTKGVVPIVAAMMLGMTVDFLKKSYKKLGWLIALIILIPSAVGILLLGVHPGIVIGILLVLSLVLPVKGGHES